MKCHNLDRAGAAQRRIRRVESNSVFLSGSADAHEWLYRDGKYFHPFSPSASVTLEVAHDLFAQGSGLPQIEVDSGSFTYKVDFGSMKRYNLKRRGVQHPRSRSVRRRLVAAC